MKLSLTNKNLNIDKRCFYFYINKLPWGQHSLPELSEKLQSSQTTVSIDSSQCDALLFKKLFVEGLNKSFFYKEKDCIHCLLLRIPNKANQVNQWSYTKLQEISNKKCTAKSFLNESVTSCR